MRGARGSPPTHGERISITLEEPECGVIGGRREGFVPKVRIRRSSPVKTAELGFEPQTHRGFDRLQAKRGRLMDV